MSIITKKGDSGLTELIGETVHKTDLRIELIGAVDEVISHLSFANSFITSEKYIEEITICQEALFKFNSQVAGADFEDLSKFTEYFEDSVKMNEPGSFSFSFVNHKAASCVDIARTVIRKAERIFCKTLIERDDLRKFINRISDFLYIFSRLLDAEEL